jgi:hypothetical protein
MSRNLADNIQRLARDVDEPALVKDLERFLAGEPVPGWVLK